jgi:DNA-binding transcriptional ArsR family regulator
MAQTAARLRLVEAASTGYARKAWISHVIETAPDEVGGVELALLKELADLVDDATGWVEASYEKLAHRTRFSLKTVRRAVKVLAAAGLIEPELIRGQGRDRIRYRFPAMHAWLAERKAHRDGGQPDHGHSDRGHGDGGQTARLTVVKSAPETDPPPAPPPKEPRNKPSARAPAREGVFVSRVGEESRDTVRLLMSCQLRVEAGAMVIEAPTLGRRNELLGPRHAGPLARAARAVNLNGAEVVHVTG